jgi:hypothetical protein
MQTQESFLAPLANDKEAWTDDDNDLLMSLMLTDPRPPIDEIAACLGRTTGAISHHMSIRKMRPTPGSKMRPCITKCGRSFFSSWIGERICPTCKHSDLMSCA